MTTFINALREFFCVFQGPFMGPCTNAKYPNFSQFDKKNPNQKIDFSSIQYLLNFHLEVLSFSLKSNDIRLYDYM